MKQIIEHILQEEMKGDTSFQEKENILTKLFGTHKYSQVEMRETFYSGIKHGIEIGLQKASLDGQIIQLNENTIESKNKEFLEKFYELCNEYNCGIQYHPTVGMVAVSLKSKN